MALTMTEEEFLAFLRLPKFVSGPLRYQKKNKNYHVAQARIRCPDAPEVNLRMISQYHVTRIPRKFTILMLADNERVFAIDVNPGTTHTNPNTLKSIRVVRGSHWQIYPNVKTAIPNNISRTHQQWMADFLRDCNITIEGGYTSPSFEVENVQLNFLGGEI